MVVLQRWEPVISPTFPSQIPFWIRIHGLPLHYWHEKVLYNIGFDLGKLDDYSITKTSIKMRISLDAFKALEKEVLFDFSSGEELVLQLQYANLGKHCSECHSILHEGTHCSLRKSIPAVVATDTQSHRARSEGRGDTTRDKPPDFSHRVDRHGRPYGDRLPPINRGVPLRNKFSSNSITPDPTVVPTQFGNARRPSRSPPRSRTRRHNEGRFSPNRDRPAQQWREKAKESYPLAQQRPSSPPRATTGRAIPPLERNLALSDFPQLPQLPSVPTREEVLDELREATLMYTNCADPKEKEARMQRVFQSEMEGLTEKTATFIIESATAQRNAVLLGSSSRGDDLMAENLALSSIPLHVLPPAGAKVTKKRGRPAKKPAASPIVFAGLSSNRILQSQTQGSPAGSRSHGPSPRQQRSSGTSTNTIPPRASNPGTPPPQGDLPVNLQSDFQAGENLLP